MTTTFSLNTRSHSEIGLVRKNNQDSGYVSATMLAVADGMGGAAAGDLASTVAIDHICAADAHREGEDMLTTLAGAVAAANDDLADLVAGREPRWHGYDLLRSHVLRDPARPGAHR